MTKISGNFNSGQISSHKLQQITSSKNIKEATHPRSLKEFIDSIIDWFQGGKKRDQVIELFTLISRIKNPRENSTPKTLTYPNLEIKKETARIKIPEVLLPENHGNPSLQPENAAEVIPNKSRETNLTQDTINHILHPVINEETMRLAYFIQLQLFSLPEYRGKFHINITNNQEINGTLSYALLIDNQEIYSNTFSDENHTLFHLRNKIKDAQKEINNNAESPKINEYPMFSLEIEQQPTQPEKPMKTTSIHQPKNKAIDLNLINEKKLKAIISAKSRSQATRAENLREFIDNIIDRWFHGGIKHKTIISLFDSISGIKNQDQKPESGKDADIKRLNMFSELRNLAKEDYRDRFFIKIEDNPENSEKWSYTLFIGEQEIFRQAEIDKCTEARTTADELKNNFETGVKNKIKSVLDAISKISRHHKSKVNFEKNIPMTPKEARLNSDAFTEFLKFRKSTHPEYHPKISIQIGFGESQKIYEKTAKARSFFQIKNIPDQEKFPKRCGFKITISTENTGLQKDPEQWLYPPPSHLPAVLLEYISDIADSRLHDAEKTIAESLRSMNLKKHSNIKKNILDSDVYASKNLQSITKKDGATFLCYKAGNDSEHTIELKENDDAILLAALQHREYNTLGELATLKNLDPHADAAFIDTLMSQERFYEFRLVREYALSTLGTKDQGTSKDVPFLPPSRVFEDLLRKRKVRGTTLETLFLPRSTPELIRR